MNCSDCRTSMVQHYGVPIMVFHALSQWDTAVTVVAIITWVCWIFHYLLQLECLWWNLWGKRCFSYTLPAGLTQTPETHAEIRTPDKRGIQLYLFFYYFAGKIKITGNLKGMLSRCSIMHSPRNWPLYANKFYLHQIYHIWTLKTQISPSLCTLWLGTFPFTCTMSGYASSIVSTINTL